MAIINNDFGLDIGINGTNAFVPLPIGTTYSGGDGVSVTRSSKDGTVTLVRANTKDIKFSMNGFELNVGECKLFDTVTADNVTETTWHSVMNEYRNFTGDIVIENGLVRIKIPKTEAAGQIDVYYWTGSAWSTAIPVTLTRTGTTHFGTVVKNIVKQLTFDAIQVMTIWKQTDNGVMNSYITMHRGQYGYDIEFEGVGGITTTAAKEAGSDTCRIVTYHDGIDGYLFDSTLASTIQDITYNTGGDNYIVGLDTTNGAIFVRSVRKATTGATSTETKGIMDTAMGTKGVSVDMKTHVGYNAIIPKSGLSNYIKQAEDMTLTGATSYVDATAIGGNCIRMAALNDKATYTFVAGTDVPLGTYKMFIRARQSSSSVTGDLRVYANADPLLGTTTVDMTVSQVATSWTIYTADLVLNPESDTKTITVEIQKMKTDSTNLDVDCVVLVPRQYFNASGATTGNGPLDVAHQALVSIGERQLAAKSG